MKDNFAILFTLISGAWILWNYLFKRSFAPKVKMNISGNIIGKDPYGQKILWTNLIISNLGEVRLKAPAIELTVRGIENTSKFKKGDATILNQVNFDKRIYQENLIPKSWHYTFVDPGITQEYQYSILIPRNIKYVLLEGKIIFSKNNFQLTSNILKIENENQ